MAKVDRPESFCDCFNVNPLTLDSLGIFNPTLAVDTKLFIDPLLFPESALPEIHDAAVHLYRKHFEDVIAFLARTQHRNDVAWRSARRLLEFHEIRGTCLGYGAASISGSGFGADLTDRILRVGKEIVDLGIHDPDLFPAMALFEADIGPDRVSDMATNVVRRALTELNHRILRELGLLDQATGFNLVGINGRFLVNPLQRRRTPIILVPKDVLRKLPIATDWDSAATSAAETQALRQRVNEHIGQIWAARTRRDKAELRREVLASAESFETLLDVLRGVPRRAYPVDEDPDGLVSWARVAQRFARENPLDLPSTPAGLFVARDYIFGVVEEIIRQFRFLVEHRGLNKEFFGPDGSPRHESSAQRLFFAIAYSYCKANNIDISPEVDTGSGEIDFKFSQGFNDRVLVEVKLSTNPKLLPGYKNQLETYKTSEETGSAFYLVIDVGRMSDKDEKLLQFKNEAVERGEPASQVEFIDARPKPSASKR